MSVPSRSCLMHFMQRPGICSYVCKFDAPSLKLIASVLATCRFCFSLFSLRSPRLVLFSTVSSIGKFILMSLIGQIGARDIFAIRLELNSASQSICAKPRPRLHPLSTFFFSLTHYNRIISIIECDRFCKKNVQSFNFTHERSIDLTWTFLYNTPIMTVTKNTGQGEFYFLMQFPCFVIQSDSKVSYHRHSN